MSAYADLHADFTVKQWQEDLLAKFIVRNEAPPITGSGTVLWLRLDEGSGTKADDSSGQDNDGQLVNAPAWVSGVFGEALDFAGTNQRVDLPAAFDALTAATLTLWFKYSTIAADSVIFSDYKDDANRFNPFVRNSDKRLESGFILAGIAYTVVSDDPIIAGNWYQAAFVLGLGGGKLYVNGVLQADTDPATICFDDLAPATSVQIGALGGGAPFKGTIDDFRIYDRELTSDEIMALYLNSDLPSEFIARQASSGDLKCVFGISQYEDLLAAMIVRNASSVDLHADFTSRHASSAELLSAFKVRHSATEDLVAEFISRHSDVVDLPSEFISRHASSAELLAGFKVRHEAYIDLHVEFKPGIFWSGGPVVVPCEFTVRQSSSTNLHADFTVIPAEDLKALFILRQEGAQDLKAEFISRQAGSADLHMGFRVATTWSGGPEDLFSKFVARHAATSDLHAEFVSRHASLIDLPSEFVSRHTYSIDLPADLIARHSATSDLKTKLIIRHSASLDLKTKFIVYHLGSAELACEFIARQSGLQNLHADFTIRQSSASDLKCDLWVRFPTRLWTNRRYLNGVINLAEGLIGDAILEYVTEGVMEDIQGYLSTHDVSYDTWTDITLVPVLIRRATTYGVVASLYARHTKTFTSRVIPSVAPVTVTVIGDAERAMQYWEDRMEKRLEEYLASAGGIVMKSSTEDEEPIFSMDDIPSEVSDYTSWHEWLEQTD